MSLRAIDSTIRSRRAVVFAACLAALLGRPGAATAQSPEADAAAPVELDEDAAGDSQPPRHNEAYLRRLGEHFYAEGHFYRAIGTFEELALFTDDEALRRLCRLRIAMAYHRGEQFADAVAAYDRLLDEFRFDADSGALVRLQRIAARSDLLLGSASDAGADVLLAELAPLVRRPEAPHFVLASYYLARLHLQNAEVTPAREALGRAEGRCRDRPIDDCRLLEKMAAAIDRRQPRRRSPALALGLSAAVPGLGAVYTEHYVDGLYYFTLTSASALGAYDVYDSGRSFGDQKTSFYVLGSLAVAFYTANLAQGYLSAKRFNVVERRRYRRQVLRDTEAPLPYDLRSRR